MDSSVIGALCRKVTRKRTDIIPVYWPHFYAAEREGVAAVLIGWFALLVLLALAGFRLGHRVGQGADRRAWALLLCAFGLIAFWTWLQHNPGFAVHVIPVSLLSCIEGVGAIPLFLFITGVAWARATRIHQKRLTLLAASLGGVIFLQGSMWMLQTTPSAALGDERSRMIMQSQDFSCVPASCATALNRIGVRATEAEMAELTFTRPGTGATLIRALDGLRKKLAGTDFDAELIDATAQELTLLQPPLLTPLRFEATQSHMVVIVEVHPSYGVVFIDPTNGPERLRLTDFAEVYSGSVIQFFSAK